MTIFATMNIIPHMLAYIDPGTGSIVLQAIAAAVAGTTIVIRLFWHQILKFFGFGKKMEPDSISPQDKEE